MIATDGNSLLVGQSFFFGGGGGGGIFANIAAKSSLDTVGGTSGGWIFSDFLSW